MRKLGPSMNRRQKGERRIRHERNTNRTSHADSSITNSQGSAQRPHSSFRAGLAVIGGRAAGALSRRLNLGGGTSIVGLVAQRLDPEIVNHLATQLEHGSVLVTGTNGKTTTSGFIAAILSDAGLRVWRNREGSNLIRGIAGALVIRARLNGRLRRRGQAISIFEVDEAVMPQVVRTITPRVAVFTNLFRDQLDRYGEVDSVTTRWRQAVGVLQTDKTTLVLNADDPTTAYLGESYTGQKLFFGIDDLSLDLITQASPSERHQVIDARTCPRCGSEFTYTTRFYSHLGHYQCPNCGYSRPQPEIRALKVYTDSFDRIRMLVKTPTQQGEVIIPLPGMYNVYNALATIATSQALEISWEPTVTGIEQFKPVFGRGERVQVEGRTVRLLLAKNPTGFNEVLRTLFGDGLVKHVLFILNDNTADGRDISWIWDVDFEQVHEQTATLVVAGTRSLDLALRLKYAGIDEQEMIIIPPAPLLATRRKIMSKALNLAISQTPAGETLFIVPTYTGLLEIHHELERRGLTSHYWEGLGP